jgi:hypothetical protein
MNKALSLIQSTIKTKSNVLGGKKLENENISLKTPKTSAG